MSNFTISYEEEEQPAEKSCIMKRFYVNVVLCGGLCLLGIVGNLISFLVLGRDRCSPVASFLLQSLSVTDMVFLCTAIIQYSVRDALYMLSGDGNIHQKLAKSWSVIRVYTFPFLFIGQTTTFWMTVLIAISRAVAVCLPYKAGRWCNIKRMKVATGLVIVSSFVYNLPRFFEHRVLSNGNIASLLTASFMYRKIYQNILYNLLCFGVPLLLLIVLNAKLIVVYRKIVLKRRRLLRGNNGGGGAAGNRQSSNCHHHNNNNNLQEDNITLVMIIVVLVFIVCNLPSRLIQIVTDYKVGEACGLYWWLTECATILEVVNCSMNFVVYCLVRARFRAILYEWVNCRRCQSGGRAINGGRGGGGMNDGDRDRDRDNDHHGGGGAACNSPIIELQMKTEKLTTGNNKTQDTSCPFGKSWQLQTESQCFLNA